MVDRKRGAGSSGPRIGLAQSWPSRKLRPESAKSVPASAPLREGGGAAMQGACMGHARETQGAASGGVLRGAVEESRPVVPSVSHPHPVRWRGWKPHLPEEHPGAGGRCKSPIRRRRAILPPALKRHPPLGGGLAPRPHPIGIPGRCGILPRLRERSVRGALTVPLRFPRMSTPAPRPRARRAAPGGGGGSASSPSGARA